MRRSVTGCNLFKGSFSGLEKLGLVPDRRWPATHALAGALGLGRQRVDPPEHGGHHTIAARSMELKEISRG
jgi:hypothetical protein